MSIDEKTNNIIKGFSSKVLLAKGIPELYEILKSKIDQISEEIGFKEIGISVCVDKDQNLVAAKPDLSNVDSMRRVYLNYFSKGVMEELIDKPIDPKPILEKEFIIPFQTNEIFEMPRSETKIKKLEEQGILPKNIWKSLEDDYYDTYRPRLLKSGKEPASFEMYRGGLLVPLLIDKNFNYGQIGFSVFNQDPEKYPDLARLTLEDDIPDKYKEMITEITSEFSPIIFNILKLHKEHKLRTAAEQAKKETEEKNEELIRLQAQLVEREKEALKLNITKGIIHDYKNLLVNLGMSLKGVGRPFKRLDSFIGLLASANNENLEEVVEQIKSHPFVRSLSLSKEKMGKMSYTISKMNELLSSFESGDSYSFRPMRVEQVIDDVVASYDLQLSGAKVSKNYTPQDYQVNGDSYQLERAITNIISNFNEATAQTPDRRLDIKTVVEENMHRTYFKDNGPGISVDVQSKLFDPYFSTKELKESRERGLGLFNVKTIIQAHGGNVGVNSEPGKGSEFYFEIPLI